MLTTEKRFEQDIESFLKAMAVTKHENKHLA